MKSELKQWQWPSEQMWKNEFICEWLSWIRLFATSLGFTVEDFACTIHMACHVLPEMSWDKSEWPLVLWVEMTMVSWWSYWTKKNHNELPTYNLCLALSWQGYQLFSVRIISSYLDLVNALLNAIRDFGSAIKSCLKLGIFNSHERLVRTDGGAVRKVTSCRPRRGTLLICNMPVDKGVPCGSVSCAHTPAECQTTT